MTATQIAPRLRFATRRLRTGPLVHYAEQGDPNGEALLFLHGYTDSWFSFSRLLPLLPDRYHAYALSQRGHGDSERLPDGYAIDDFAADVVAFLDAAGAARATLVGHSMSSQIARRVAATRPERVARLVLIGALATPVNAAVLELRDAVRALEDPVPPDFVRDFQASTIHAPVPLPFFDRVVAESLMLPSRVWQAVADGFCAFDDRADLARIAAPTLILWGDRDAYFPGEEQKRLAGAIPGARLTVYPETGHTPHWERPERVAADLAAFIGGASPTPATRAGVNGSSIK
jgi:pimeloyl-ACP methyl ester carboxylesterase